MTADAVLPPSHPTKPRTPWAIAAFILAAILFLGVGGRVPTLAPLLDLVIRHQTLFFTIVGLVLAVLIITYAAEVGRISEARATVKAQTGREFVPAVIVAPLLLPFMLAAGASVAGGAAVGAVSPIPRTVGLELPPPLRDTPQNRALLLFIHGWNGDSAGTWRQFPQLVIADDRFSAYNVWSIDYPTFMLRRNLSIAQLADFFTRHFDDSSRIFDRYERVVVVAHSMGGLVAREVAIQQTLRSRPQPFAKIIEIATPHEGADPAGLAKALRLTRPLTDDMQKGSEFLRDLRTHWFALRSKPPTFCIGSPQDVVVSIPSATSQCTDATNYFEGSHTAIVKPVSHADLRYTTPMAHVLTD